MRCVAVRYSDYPTVEWTLWLKNTGAADTPVIEHIQPLDMEHNAPAGRQPMRSFITTWLACESLGLRPSCDQPARGATKHIPQQADGPQLRHVLLQLEWGGSGMIVVVGWPGSGAADFSRDRRRLHISAARS